jgi:hypothetical protein
LGDHCIQRFTKHASVNAHFLRIGLPRSNSGVVRGFDCLPEAIVGL